MTDAPSGSTPFTVFDYLGLAFILGPPGVAVEGLMKGDELKWSYAWYGVPAVIVGSICIYVGRNWEGIKGHLWTRLTNGIDKFNNGYFIAVIAFVVLLFLMVLSPLLLFPPASQKEITTLAALDGIAAAVVNKMPKAASVVAVPSANEIADAIVRKLPSGDDNAAQISQLKSELTDAQRQRVEAQRGTQAASQEATAARSSLAEIQRQQQAVQSNQFVFSPNPILKRKLTRSEAVDLIDKLTAFSDIFQSLEKPMSVPIIPSPYFNRYAPPAPRELSKKKDMLVDVLERLKTFNTALQQQVSMVPGFKGEIDEMLGGSGWPMSSGFDELSQSIVNYCQVLDQTIARPVQPDDELIGYILRDPQSGLVRSAQRFNSWRSQIRPRIQELQNEARGDL